MVTVSGSTFSPSLTDLTKDIPYSSATLADKKELLISETVMLNAEWFKLDSAGISTVFDLERDEPQSKTARNKVLSPQSGCYVFQVIWLKEKVVMALEQCSQQSAWDENLVEYMAIRCNFPLLWEWWLMAVSKNNSCQGQCKNMWTESSSVI